MSEQRVGIKSASEGDARDRRTGRGLRNYQNQWSILKGRDTGLVGGNEDPSVLWRRVDEAFEILPRTDRVALRAAVADNVLEGWQPTKVDTNMLVAFATGAITMKDRAWVRRDWGTGGEN
jgi:hypothetical protein